MSDDADKPDGPMSFRPATGWAVTSPRVPWTDAPPQSEFLPVTAVHFVRVSDVRSVWLMEWSIELVRDEEQNWTRVTAPYFAAWLDRLGIPWTDDLRKAHEAGKESPNG